MTARQPSVPKSIAMDGDQCKMIDAAFVKGRRRDILYAAPSERYRCAIERRPVAYRPHGGPELHSDPRCSDARPDRYLSGTGPDAPAGGQPMLISCHAAIPALR